MAASLPHHATGYKTSLSGDREIGRVTNTGFMYDNAGNLTFDGLYNYTWDGENHLKSANGVNYTYDGDLRWVEKSNGKLYWYSTSGQVLKGSGSLINDYIYLGAQRIARHDASGNIYYYFTDPWYDARDHSEHQQQLMLRRGLLPLRRRESRHQHLRAQLQIHGPGA